MNKDCTPMAGKKGGAAPQGRGGMKKGAEVGVAADTGKGGKPKGGRGSMKAK